jgi:outer membrane protein assembly factor BamD
MPLLILVATTVRLRSRMMALALPLAIGGCSLFNSSDSDQTKVDPSTVPVEVLYNQGVDALQGGRYSVAATQFDDVQQYYPYSTWAARAELNQGYAEYLQHKYDDAIATLDRFVQLHPAHPDAAYAYYLRALCYYEQVEDIQREQKGTREAMAALQDVVTHFPDSSYARDARLKIDLCNDRLAGKEMEIGRFYERQHLYGAALGRFQRVVDDYQTTNHVPEALHRLTEIYLLLGLPQEARRTAAVLGHNYPGSSWYSASYRQLVADDELTGTSATATAPPHPEPGVASHAANGPL